MKEKLKERIKQRQHGRCAISKENLEDQTRFFDTDRKTEKFKGGVYSNENTRVVTPVAHLKRHGNFRKRDEELEKLKQLVDAKEQLLKLRNKVDNQLLAYKRQTDKLDQEIADTLNQQSKDVEKQVGRYERKIAKMVKEVAKIDPVANATLNIKSVGENTIAYLLVYIDINKARHPSSLWQYTGLGKPSHERYEKGVAGGGNKRLRSALWNMANSQVKQHGPYRAVYDNAKARRSVSEQKVKTRNTQGKEIICAWKDTKPSHRHGDALRQIVKHFLADYWFVARKLNGLETNPVYAEAQLGMGHKTINPKERGWEF